MIPVKVYFNNLIKKEVKGEKREKGWFDGKKNGQN
jgi:hypothetical protein